MMREDRLSTDDHAVIRESVIERSCRRAIQEHLRYLLADGWPRERVEALARQALDDAVREHLMRRRPDA